MPAASLPSFLNAMKEVMADEHLKPAVLHEPDKQPDEQPDEPVVPHQPDKPVVLHQPDKPVVPHQPEEPDGNLKPVVPREPDDLEVPDAGLAWR